MIYWNSLVWFCNQKVAIANPGPQLEDWKSEIPNLLAQWQITSNWAFCSETLTYFHVFPAVQ